MDTMIAPIIPPAAALKPNALWTIVTIAAGTFVILKIMIRSAAATYKIAIKGTTT